MRIIETPFELQQELEILLTALTEYSCDQIKNLEIMVESVQLDEIDWFKLPPMEPSQSQSLTLYKGGVWSGLSALYGAKEKGQKEIEVYHLDNVLPDFFERGEVVLPKFKGDYGIESVFFDMPSFSVRDGKLYNSDYEVIGNLKISQCNSLKKAVVLDSIEVMPKFQNSGVGTKVMGEILSLARQSGLIVGLTTESMLGSQHQARLRKWYESLGFSTTPSRSKLGTEYFKLPQPRTSEMSFSL
ncbi:GNAT family N-acetyltransferase [Vibrio harveyi]|uniref:GNAT family N-acetyltransferase n=1 Tax=Vibrio harveyi TaxID=669 RepID=UPI003CEEBADD